MTTRLHAAEMLAAAEAETGLRDYGDPTLPERFAVAVDHLTIWAWMPMAASKPRRCVGGC